MPLREKVELLGKGLYESIPDVLTLTSIPTASELDYVGAEDFDDVMLDKILPSVIVEDIDPKKLLEIDYQWVLRALRLINYGPYIHVGAIFCETCGTTSRGDYMVSLETVECKPLPDNFKNKLVVKKDEFLDFDRDIEFHLPTIQQILNSRKDKQFQDALGNVNNTFARICYSIHSIGGITMDPVNIRMTLQNELTSADYIILRDRMVDLMDYGLRGGGRVKCPKCGDQGAAFVAFVDEHMFRPSVDCLRKWRDDKGGRES